MARNYKEEYEKFQKEKSSYRAKLNKYNRDKGTYGNGDGMDASHKNGKISGFEPSSKNKGKAEKSRLKGSKRKFLEGGKLKGKSHKEGGIPIEAEGGEYIIKKTSVNRDTLDTLDYINKHGDLPVYDSKKRRK
tara:strand:- start:363 stop:761 length:399 start_codon:yes stop_codon:yes gene_type:complete